MDIRIQIVTVAVVILLVMVVLAARFLSRRARLGLYGVILISAVAVWAYVQLNSSSLLSKYALELYAEGFNQPVYAIYPPDDSGRFFVVERRGSIRILENGALLESPFLDITDRVLPKGDEQGLLSMAFHPNFTENGFFYIYYTLPTNDSLLARYQVSDENPNLADPNSETILLTTSRPTDHHNGGLLLFGPDGYLYLGIGNGGWGLETLDAAQDRSNLLGSLIRLDVSNPASDPPYAIPPDNPFVDEPGVRPEIWAYGLRNPWRYAFDAQTGDLYLTDVGDIQREEINFQPAGQGAGANYGWRWFEGTRAVENPADGAPPEGLVFPIAEYDHLALGGCAIVGGYVYRGQAIPDLAGSYVYSDFCSGFVWGLQRTAAGAVSIERLLRQENLRLSSFAIDREGELYLLDVAFGKIYKLVEK